MTRQTTTVLEYGLQEFMFACEKLRLDGWEWDEQSPPAFYGFCYEAHLHRDPTQIQLDKDAAEAAKPSRAEILAAARAAKKAKAGVVATEDSVATEESA